MCHRKTRDLQEQEDHPHGARIHGIERNRPNGVWVHLRAADRDLHDMVVVVSTTPRHVTTALDAWCTTRDHSARDTLVRAYAPLVESVLVAVSRSLPAHVDRDDLRACGMMGLLAALDRYDPARGAAFATFARPRVRGAMLDHVRRLAPSGRTTIVTHDPTPLIDTADPAHVCNRREEHRMLRAALADLEQRDQDIVRLRHVENWSLRRIARHLNLSESRVSRLHARALERLGAAFAH